MQFAIITALISIITLSFKYMEESMNNTRDALIILDHSLIINENINKLIKSEMIYNYVLSFAFLLLILSNGLSKEFLKDNVMLLILFIFIVTLLQYALNIYSYNKICSNIHHSIDIEKIKTHGISLIIPFLILGCVLGCAWFKISEEVLLKKIGIDIPTLDWIILTVVVLLLPLMNLIQNTKIPENKLAVVKPDTNVVIHRKYNKDFKVYIIKNNISIDKDGYVWVYNRNNIKEDIAYFKLDENTTLQIGDKRITNKKDDIETNYTKYI